MTIEPVLAANPEPPLAPSALADPVVPVEIDEVSFDGSWRKTTAFKRLHSLDFSFRVIGYSRIRNHGKVAEGILLRSIKAKTYFFVPNEGRISELPGQETERALFELRRGHHGGAGRAQGSRAKDGMVYTRRYTVTVSPDTISTIVGKGDGEMSAGLRHVAGLIRRRFSAAGCDVGDLREIMEGVSSKTGKSSSLVMISIYVDKASHDTLTALGGGNLSRGIRYAAWLAPRQLSIRKD